MKKMKKQVLAGLLIGCIMITGTTMAVMANGNSYQNFRTAALKTMQQDNMTISSEFTIKQNGIKIVAGNSVIQKNGEQKHSMGTIESGSQSIELERTLMNQTMVGRIDDQYYKMEIEDDDDDRNHKRDKSPNTEKMMEMMTDVLIGDLKTHFTSNNNHISVTLTGAQIPELLNVMVAAMAEQSHDRPRKVEGCEAVKDLFSKIDFTSLTNVSIKELALDSDLQDGYLTNNTFNITIIGTDQQGQNQEIEASFTVVLSDLGNTSPGSIDLTGKEIKELTSNDFDH